MPAGRPEDPTIAALEDTAGALSVALEAFTVVVTRQRFQMTDDDWREYERAIEAHERAVAYLKQIRALYHEGKRTDL